ncbi:MAG: Lrp/AsnC family transcriptional regulator [Anaerolineales bacterium]
MTSLDLVDYEVISVLHRDGRCPAVKIAKEIGVSEATVRRRVEKLVEEGVIRIAAVSDPHKLGFPLVIYGNAKIDHGNLNEAAETLAEFKEVRFVAITAGRHTLTFEAWFGTNEHLLEFLTERLDAIEGISDVEVSQLLYKIKDNYYVEGTDIIALAEQAFELS